jgi:curli biogenesis system outer membrane secretion channel CsgG
MTRYFMMYFILMLVFSWVIQPCRTVDYHIIEAAEYKTVYGNGGPASETAEHAGKLRVAIVEFTNEKNHELNYFLDEYHYTAGKRARDFLNVKLAATDKFILVDVSENGTLKNTPGMSDPHSLEAGAEYLILGSICDLRCKTVRGTGIAGGTRRMETKVRICVKLIDMNTGYVIYSEATEGKAVLERKEIFFNGTSNGHATRLNDRALYDAVSNLEDNIIHCLLERRLNYNQKINDNFFNAHTGDNLPPTDLLGSLNMEQGKIRYSTGENGRIE